MAKETKKQNTQIPSSTNEAKNVSVTEKSADRFERFVKQLIPVQHDHTAKKKSKVESKKMPSEEKKTNNNKNKRKKAATKNSMGFIDRLVSKVFMIAPKDEVKDTVQSIKTEKNTEEGQETKKAPKTENKKIKSLSLRKQVQYLLNLPDDEYSDDKLTSQLRTFIQDTENHYNTILKDFKTHIAPSFWEVKPTSFRISGILGKTYYTHSYPSYMDALWTRDILDYHGKRDLSIFIYPEDDSRIKSTLKQRSTQLKAEINDALAKGITLDTEVQVQYQDVEMIRQKLATHEERYFETGMYMTIYEQEEEKIRESSKKIEQKLAGLSLRTKPATFRMDDGLVSSLPLCIDNLGITRSTITSSLAGSFPFISQDIIHKTGILYGVNLHTGGLIVFDRFNSKLPNMNSVVLATSGAGKSFAVKLEILRYLLNGIDIIVIDPENEYKSLIEKVGGTYINVATSSQQYINPFDLPPAIEDIDYQEGDLLRSQISQLLGLMNIILGKLSPRDEAVMDKALQNTYSLKGITLTQKEYNPNNTPTMEDLLQVLEGMEGGEELALKLSKYVSGTFGKIFNNLTNININDRLTIFSIRDLDDALKTPAMYNILNFIWTEVRANKKPRLIICDEAWILLQNDISANFLYGLTKRARKYQLGITTITQDIEDLIRSPYGKPIVSNASMQLLLKQSTSSIKTLEEVVGLSEAEKQRLVASGIGEGLMFVGGQHVAVKILASQEEKNFIDGK